MNQTDKIFFRIGLIILGGVAVTALLQLTGILRLTDIGYPCFFQRVTHFPCPGCGGTRAVCFLAEGNLVQSFLKHPFVPYTGIGFFFYVMWNTIAILQQKFAKKDSPKMPIWHFKAVYVFIGIGLIFIQWGIKLALLF